MPLLSLNLGGGLSVDSICHLRRSGFNDESHARLGCGKSDAETIA
jgi:hypothetical protein